MELSRVLVAAGFVLLIVAAVLRSHGSSFWLLAVAAAIVAFVRGSVLMLG